MSKEREALRELVELEAIKEASRNLLPSDRNATVEELRKSCEMLSEYKRRWPLALESARTILQSQEGSEPVAWISVDDHLPEKELGYVLVSVTKAGVDVDRGFVSDAPVDIANTLFVHANAKEGWFSHWMPLPDAASESQEAGGEA